MQRTTSACPGLALVAPARDSPARLERLSLWLFLVLTLTLALVQKVKSLKQKIVL